jgi:hypothetical protein
MKPERQTRQEKIDLQRGRAGWVVGSRRLLEEYFVNPAPLSINPKASTEPKMNTWISPTSSDALTTVRVQVELILPQDANVFASKYQLYLPPKEDLKAWLEQIAHDLEGGAQQ